MTRKLVPSLLGAAFVLMLSGGAMARRPPSLVKLEAASAWALAACPEPTGAGYRDMLARSHMEVPATGHPEQIITVIPHRRAVDDVVITCVTEVVHTGNGYRDILLRFEPESTSPVVATRR